MIKDGGRLNDKFPGGATAHAALLEAEGHIVEIAKGGRHPKVVDFEKRLAKL